MRRRSPIGCARCRRRWRHDPAGAAARLGLALRAEADGGDAVIRQALRRNPWSFLGPFSTQMLAAALVAAGLGITTSIDRAPLDAAARQALTDSGVADIAIIFVMIAIYLSIIIVGVTMAATIAQQARDIALVRAIGATPERVRRSVAAQAAIVAVPATLFGV